MAKYSIIIPVYNAEPYLSKCLESVLKQNFEDYEIIVVNDGSTDNSEDIILKFNNSMIKYFTKENGGVSDARNYGIDKAKGQYFTFVDADDYVSNDFLEVIDSNIQSEIDILSFNMIVINQNLKIKNETTKPSFKELDGQKAIVKFIEQGEMFDTPVTYVYKTSYFKENNFKYIKGKVHEDFGLTPLTIIKAKTVSSISDCLYYYVQNETGITGDNTKKNLTKKAWDMLYHFDYLYSNVNNDVTIEKNVKKIFNSFIANAVINKAASLTGDDLKKYLKELKSRKVSSLLLGNNINRLLKKLMVKLNPKAYLNFIVKTR